MNKYLFKETLPQDIYQVDKNKRKKSWMIFNKTNAERRILNRMQNRINQPSSRNAFRAPKRIQNCFLLNEDKKNMTFLTLCIRALQLLQEQSRIRVFCVYFVSSNAEREKKKKREILRHYFTFAFPLSTDYIGDKKYFSF